MISAIRSEHPTGAALDNDLPKARHALLPACATPRMRLKGGDGQHEIDKYAGAERDEQKDAETPKLAIGHDGLKLAENSGADKRFSRSRLAVGRFCANR